VRSRAARCAPSRWRDRCPSRLRGCRLHAACFHSVDAYRTIDRNAAVVRLPANAPNNRHLQPVEVRGTPNTLSEILASRCASAMTENAPASADELKAAPCPVARFGAKSSRAQVAPSDSRLLKQCDTAKAGLLTRMDGFYRLREPSGRRAIASPPRGVANVFSAKESIRPLTAILTAVAQRREVVARQLRTFACHAAGGSMHT